MPRNLGPFAPCSVIFCISCVPEKSNFTDSTDSTVVTGTDTVHEPTTSSDSIGICDGGVELFQIPQDLLSPDSLVSSGLTLCMAGILHRHTAVACQFKLEPSICSSCDHACTDFPAGACHLFDSGCDCAYPCAVDSDCGTDAVCLCASGRELNEQTYPVIDVSQCVTSNCNSDEDCGGFLCAASRDICRYRVLGLFCHSESDECLSDLDCIDLGQGDRCSYDNGGQRWVCSDYSLCE